MKLLETIRYELGEFSNLRFHQNRMNNSRKVLFNCTDEIDLTIILNESSNNISEKELYKCRVVYDTEVRKVEYIPYKIPDINSLKLVDCDEIEYGHKYIDRNQINDLLIQKDDADDIIIVKNDLITDTTFANLLFYNGIHWVTPAFPLLKGTQRSHLLEKELIITANIQPEDLVNFKKIRLINAMLRFEDEVDVNIGNVHS